MLYFFRIKIQGVGSCPQSRETIEIMPFFCKKNLAFSRYEVYTECKME